MSQEETPDSAAPHVDEYCRLIEQYLTRKNDGHLIRIVGPSFERVRSWAERGVPLKIAFAGIDRHFERYYAKGPRRRPVRIDFCEADILDVFDEWRRAVGLSAGRTELVDGDAPKRPARQGLARQIERAIARLTASRAASASDNESGSQRLRVPDHELEAAVRELERLVPGARSARGEKRQRILERLASIDAHLIRTARDSAPAGVVEELER